MGTSRHVRQVSVGDWNQHLHKSEHNERFLEAVAQATDTPEDFGDWQVVVLFYAAVHLVDAWLSRRDFHPTAHWESESGKPPGRTNLVAKEMPFVWPHYRALHELSRRARYDAGHTITIDQLQKSRDRYYPNVKNVIRAGDDA